MSTLRVILAAWNRIRPIIVKMFQDAGLDFPTYPETFNESSTRRLQAENPTEWGQRRHKSMREYPDGRVYVHLSFYDDLLPQVVHFRDDYGLINTQEQMFEWLLKCNAVLKTLGMINYLKGFAHFQNLLYKFKEAGKNDTLDFIAANFPFLQSWTVERMHAMLSLFLAKGVVDSLSVLNDLLCIFPGYFESRTALEKRVVLYTSVSPQFCLVLYQ